MGIYLPNMEMPVIELDWTIRRGADGKWYAIDTNAETSDGEWHEIIPVPPHGRLIDADALKTMWDDEIARLLEKGTEYLDYHVNTLFSDFKHDVDKMPTIIPSEEAT